MRQGIAPLPQHQVSSIGGRPRTVARHDDPRGSAGQHPVGDCPGWHRPAGLGEKLPRTGHVGRTYVEASALARVGEVDEIVAVHGVGYDGDGRNKTKRETLVELDDGGAQFQR